MNAGMRLLPPPAVLAASALFLTASAFAQDLSSDLTLHRLLIEGEDWQVAAEGLGFADGPCADAAGNFYFSDMKEPAIYKVAPDGTRTKLADEPASGLKFGPDGFLYACQGSKKRVIAISPDGKPAPELNYPTAITVVAQDVEPNDLVVTNGRRLYITETRKRQITEVNLQSFTTRPVDTGIAGPNGIALSADGGTLAVSESGGETVWTFRVNADDTLDAKAPYMTMRRPIDPAGEFHRAEPPPYLKGAKGDGMTADSIGRWFVTSALGVQVFDPTGRLCGVLAKPQQDKPLTSCVIVGDRLYVTSGDKIFRRRIQMPPGQ